MESGNRSNAGSRNNSNHNGGGSGIGKHRLSMEQRRECKLTGVVDVQSFDENTILMETVDGMLTIRGENLHVGRLNLEKGEADVDGVVNSFVYTDKNTFAKKGEGLLTRLFG